MNSSLLTPRIGPSRLATPRCIFPRTDFPLITIQYNLSSFASLLFQDLSHEMFFLMFINCRSHRAGGLVVSERLKQRSKSQAALSHVLPVSCQSPFTTKTSLSRLPHKIATERFSGDYEGSAGKLQRWKQTA